MSTIIVLTPVIIGSWPLITAAAAAAAVGLGFNVNNEVNEALNENRQEVSGDNQVEVELENSEVVAKNLALGKEVVLTKGTVTLRVQRDERGQCRVCAEGKGHTKTELKAVAEEFAKKLAQSYAYHQTMTALKSKNFQTVNEEVAEDGTIRLQVRRWVDE